MLNAANLFGAALLGKGRHWYRYVFFLDIGRICQGVKAVQLPPFVYLLTRTSAARHLSQLIPHMDVIFLNASLHRPERSSHASNPRPLHDMSPLASPHALLNV